MTYPHRDVPRRKELHVHFINLDRSKDRLAEFQSVNSHLAQITRVAAFEEHRVDLDALTRQGLVTSDILTTYPIGALCHVMSDILLWNKAIESAEQITVADDDTIFNLNFDVEAAELERVPPHSNRGDSARARGRRVYRH